MNVQYVSDDKGQVTAVQVSIEDWERLKIVHPDIADIGSTLPQWQTDLLDQRLKAIEDHPELVKPISGIMEILDREAD